MQRHNIQTFFKIGLGVQVSSVCQESSDYALSAQI